MWAMPAQAMEQRWGERETLDRGIQEGRCIGPSLWVDVLVYPEHVVGIVLALHSNKALEIATVGRRKACIALIAHHEIDVTARP